MSSTTEVIISNKLPARHPPAKKMVLDTLTELNEKNGSSLIAIKKKIAEAFDIDIDQFSRFIKAALKKLVDAGILTQTKGTGASGSFKVAVKPKPKPKAVPKIATVAAPAPKKLAQPTKKTQAVDPASKKAPIAAKTSKKAPIAIEATTTKAKPVNSSETTEKKVTKKPTIKEMVLDVIGLLNEKGGSSLQAVKKQMALSYAVDVDRMAPFIRAALKNHVDAGKLIQKKGTGATGSFKLPTLKPRIKILSVKQKLRMEAKEATKKKSTSTKKTPAPKVKVL